MKDKRIARGYGYSARGTDVVVRDYSYSRWAPHYSAICAISSERLVVNWLLKNPEERFDVRSFIQFLHERLLPAMNRFNGENPRSVIVMVRINCANLASLRPQGRPIVVIQYSVNNNSNAIAFPTDNHPAHHVQEVVEHLYNSGALIRFLPPYSPDLNPIEEVFAKVKHYLRQNDSVLQAVRDPSPLIWNAFGQITSFDCQAYMHHAGYI